MAIEVKQGGPEKDWLVCVGDYDVNFTWSVYEFDTRDEALDFLADQNPSRSFLAARANIEQVVTFPALRSRD